MNELWRWAEGDLDLRTRQLRVRGQPITLGARAFDLLAVLVQRHPQVVPKDTLLDLVWPHLVVEESNLAVQVHTLRRSLGPKAIATVPGRGYQFTLPLLGEAASPPEPRPTPPAPDNPATRHLPPDPRPDWLGRGDELQSLLSALRGPSRLVTVLGVGGAGKSTLALAAAHALAEELPAVAWVELSALQDAAQLPAAVAQAAQLNLFPDDDPARALCRALAGHRGLVVLDGAEHLREAVARLVPGLLAASEHLILLVTSQAPLEVADEAVMRIGGLGLAPPGSNADAARRFAAVALFEERARAAQRRFRMDDDNVDDVIGLCARCDGLPFAIALVAAALSMFSLAQLAARIEADQPLGRHASPDAPARQHTVRAALAWSHALLTPVEQRVFRRLAVFPASFRLDMAEEVCRCSETSDEDVVDAMSVLVHRSIVERIPPSDPDAPDRYRLLDTARRFAHRELETRGEVNAVSRRHLEAVRRLAEATRPLGVGRMPLPKYRAIYGPELDNCLAALDWAVQHDGASGLRLIADGYPLFAANGRGHDMARYCTAFLPLVPELERTDSEPAGRFCLMAAVGFRYVDRRLFHQYHRMALAIFARHGHAHRVHWALCALAVQPDVGLDERLDLVRQAMAIEPDERLVPTNMAMRCMAQAECALMQGDYPAMRQHVKDAQLTLQVGSSQLAFDILENWAGFELVAGDIDRATRLAEEAELAIGAAAGSVGADSVGMRIQCHLYAGEIEKARALSSRWRTLLKQSGWAHQVYSVAPRLPLLCALEGRWFDAARLLGHARHLLDKAGFVHLPLFISHPLEHPALTPLETLVEPQLRQQLAHSGRWLHPQDAFALCFEGENRRELAPYGTGGDDTLSPRWPAAVIDPASG